jgi:hypothetical protein
MMFLLKNFHVFVPAYMCVHGFVHVCVCVLAVGNGVENSKWGRGKGGDVVFSELGGENVTSL